MVIIDKEKCIGCGMCVKDCFPRNISIENQKAQIKGPCMHCGHCIAICPVNAVSIDSYSMEEVIEYSKDDFDVDPNNLMNLIKFRRSIRYYKKDPIEKDMIEKILEAGRYSPTAANLQDVTFIVVQEKLGEFRALIWDSLYDLAVKNVNTESLAGVYAPMWIKMYNDYKSGKNDLLFFNAPTIIITTASNPLNGALSSSYIELMTNAQGLGALFSGFIGMALQNSEASKKLLGIGKKGIVTCMLLGYPDITYCRTVPRKKLSLKWK
ncbi:nitroreductase family protein [Fusobacterium sp. PH5-44]|uniref:nitroreductase family protein n=1 Tax=unclassified Fusobacterium TaxID=2648384 RepID=UPI003D21EF74